MQSVRLVFESYLLSDSDVHRYFPDAFHHHLTSLYTPHNHLISPHTLHLVVSAPHPPPSLLPSFPPSLPTVTNYVNDWCASVYATTNNCSPISNEKYTSCSPSKNVRRSSTNQSTSSTNGIQVKCLLTFSRRPCDTLRQSTWAQATLLFIHDE